MNDGHLELCSCAEWAEHIDLAERLAGKNVEVMRADATALPFAADADIDVDGQIGVRFRARRPAFGQDAQRRRRNWSFSRGVLGENFLRLARVVWR